MPNPRTAVVDIETYNEHPISNGVFRYAETAELLLFAWSVDGAPAKLWDATAAKMPAELREILEDDDTVLVAHNAAFEAAVLARVLSIEIAPTRWRCSMARAYAHALPGSLEAAAVAMGLPSDKQKDKEGKQLVRLFCCPPPKSMKRGRATRRTHPEEWEKFCHYCRQDVDVTVALWAKLPAWNYTGVELEVWHLDQRVNSRGCYIDRDLVEGALLTVDAEQKVLASRTQDLTDDEVTAATQRDKLLAHILKTYGVDLPDMQSATLERRIEDQSLPRELRELLAVRLQATTTSAAKYKKIKAWLCDDDRLRGLLQFSGAGRTRRWAGRGPQYHNLPSRGLLPRAQIDDGIEAMKAGSADLLFPNVMHLTSSAVRGTIIAPRGKKLIVADLSNIEGRDAAWLSFENWKVKAFAEFDAGTGHDLYALAYAKSFGVTPESVMADKKADGKQRDIGKVMELGLQFGGGVNAFLTFAAGYGIDLEEMAERAWASIPTATLADAEGFYDWTVRQKRSTFGLSTRAFVVCDSFKRLWRDAHPAITSYWRDLEDAASRAIRTPGVTLECRRLKIRRDGAWLRMRMPSGRFLCYPSPKIEEDGSITFAGVNQYSRKWGRIKTWGGTFFENLCQSFARDILATGMLAAERAGYEVVLSVHDELICEAPDSDEFTADGLAALMATNPEWAPDIPLAAAGFTAYRYRK